MFACFRPLIALSVVLALAACAAAPIMTPPPAKKPDAKTQLEMGQ